PDLAVTNSNYVSVLFGNGDGSFRPKVDIPAGSSTYSVAIADLNGDGKLDLATANQTSDGTVSVLLGHGDGTFATHVDYGAGSYPNDLAIADFNGDGRPDLAVTNSTGFEVPGPGGVSVLLGTGAGEFGLRSDLRSITTAPARVATGDM